METLTGLPLFITILVIAGGTVFTRALPFIIFPPGRESPAFVKRLGVLLPGAVIGLLVVYSLRHLDVFSGGRGLPELLSILAIVALHLWRKNALLSIAGGTILYMLLVQHLF